MALRGILEAGIRDAIARGRADLDAIAAESGMPEGTGEHLAHTLEAIPGLMIAVDRALRRRDVPGFARALWIETVSYLLLDEDLVPVRPGAPLRGMLDDAYLLHRAAQELREHLPALDDRSLDGGTELLRLVLPAGVVADLEEILVALRARS